MAGWIDMEADDITQLVDKVRVGGELELALTSTAFAVIAEVQWVASAGGSL